MRIVDIRPDHVQADTEAGRKTIEAEIAHPSKSVMFIVGESAEIALLADRAGTRSDPFPWREVIWLRLSRDDACLLLGDVRFEHWFSVAGVCAVVLDFQDNVVARLQANASLFEIEAAFLQPQ